MVAERGGPSVIHLSHLGIPIPGPRSIAMATDIGNMMQQVLNAQAQSAAEQAAANERTANLMQNMVQGLSAMVEQMTKQGATQEPQVQKPKFESLGGKVLEKVKKFTGGEEEWTDWSDDMRRSMKR